MIDLFLKFQNYQDAISIFKMLGKTQVNYENIEYIIQSTHQYSIWEVGEIPGKDGWHVNLRVIDHSFDTTELEPYRVYPQNPVCVWA